MTIRIEQTDANRLADYAAVPMTYEVTSVLEVEPVDNGLGGFAFREKPVTPYQKDCNMHGDASPTAWPSRFHTEDWGIFMAYRGDEHVGGATVATPDDGIVVTQGRSDTAALWDLRVAPSARRTGVGMQLLRHAADWSAGRGFRFLGIETMNVNVPACRLYAKGRSGAVGGATLRIRRLCRSRTRINDHLAIEAVRIVQRDRRRSRR